MTNAYSYDAASNRTGFTAPDGSANTYTYDTLNRLSNLQNSWAGSFGFSYDALSRRTQMTRPNGVATNYTYDNLSRLLSVLHQAGGSTIDGASYTLDPAGNRTAKADYQAHVTTNYGYDSIYELLSATGGSSPESYTYDPVGNRLSSPAASYSVNSSNEMTAAAGAMYTYDANGNTTSKIDSTGTTTYTWDFENRLTSVTFPCGTATPGCASGSTGTVTFKYDPFGRRIEKISPSATSIFAYDGDNLVETLNGSDGLVAHYTQTQNIDEPLAMQRGATTDYHEADGLGSITSLTASNGTVAQNYTYDSFGNTTNSSGALTNFFRYTARDFDTETNLYFYRARYYDPLTARFSAEDPNRFTAGVDFYVYALNSPSNFSDPLGRFPTSWHHDQTLRLANEVFGPKCADKANAVADADAAVDSPWWGIFNPFGSAWLYGGPHFPKPGTSQLPLQDALNSCSLSALGSGLHTLQDGFAHPPGPTGPPLHMLTGTLFDFTGGLNGAVALGATRAWLQDFKDKCLRCCSGGSTTQLMAQ